MSRYEAIGLIEAWCQANEPENAKCLEEWEALCKDGSRACHYMLFTYDTVVDVKNVTEFTLTGLDEGKLYYFAATAYDTDGNESLFSIELTHRFDFRAPADPKGVEQRDPAPARLQIPETFLDTIKEKRRQGTWLEGE